MRYGSPKGAKFDRFAVIGDYENYIYLSISMVRRPPTSFERSERNIQLPFLIARPFGEIDLDEAGALIEVPDTVVALKGPKPQSRLSRLGLAQQSGALPHNTHAVQTV